MAFHEDRVKRQELIRKGLSFLSKEAPPADKPARSTAPWDQPRKGTTITVDPLEDKAAILARLARLPDYFVHAETVGGDGLLSLLVTWTNRDYTSPGPNEPHLDRFGRSMQGKS